MSNNQMSDQERYDLGDITPEELGEYIRAVVLEGRRSRRHRKPIPKGTLRELCRWEREITYGYGVKK